MPSPDLRHQTPRRVPPRLHDDDRVTVTEPASRWYGETGFIDGWHYGMTGGVIHWVRLDVRADEQMPFHESELTLGEGVFTA